MVECTLINVMLFAHDSFSSSGYNNRPLAVGMSVGVVNIAATILEYNAWAFPMGHKYREHVVRSSFVVNQNGSSA